MQLTVNGAAHEHTGDPSIAAVLAALKAEPDRVALLLNGKFVARESRGAVRLRDGDVIEVIAFAAGG